MTTGIVMFVVKTVVELGIFDIKSSRPEFRSQKTHLTESSEKMLHHAPMSRPIVVIIDL